MPYDGFISYSHAADGALAPALQSGLQRLAKPWNRRRALRIFRDETGLSTNPHLWSSIETALDSSGWFILLASPEAADSSWVNKELELWLATKPADRILAVLTDGTWEWDAGHLSGTAVPAALAGAFTDEPRHLDLGWARTETDLNLRNSQFRGAVADLAAPMHGIAKDELEGEDIRQHRRARRLARGGVAVLAFLVVVAVMAGGLAVSNAGRAKRNAGRAERNARRAEREAKVASARGLAGQAVARASSAPDFALLLALEAYRADDSVESRSGLLTVLQRTSRVKRLVSASPSEVVSGLSEDGRTIAASDVGGNVHLVDFVSRRPRLSFLTKQRGPVSVFFSPDRSVVATTSEDNTVRLWDARRGRSLSATLREHSAPVRAADFSPDGRQLVTEDSAGFSYLWDVATGRLVARLAQVLNTPHIDISFSSNGTRVALSGVPPKVFEITDGTKVTETAFHGQLTGGALAFSPDGTLLASGRPGVVEIWDVASSQLRVTLRVASLTDALRFSRDGSTLAVGQGDGTTTLWDIRTGEMIGEPLIGLRGAVEHLAFAADGNLVTASAAGAAMWDLKGTALSRGTQIAPLPEGFVDLPAVAFATDGREVATFDGHLFFLDASTLERQGEPIPTASPGSSAPGVWFAGLAFGPNGQAFAAGPTAVSYVDVKSRAVTRKPLRIGRLTSALDLSGDGRLLAVGDYGGNVTLVDVARWSVRRRVKLHVVNSAVAVALSPNGRLVVSGGGDGRVVLQNTGDRSQTTLLAEGKGPIFGVDFSADGKHVAVGFGDGRVLIIDVERRLPVGAPLVGHNGFIYRVVFSPDDRMLAVTTEHGVVVWDVGTQQRIGELDRLSGSGVTGTAGGGGIAFDVAFSPDGKALATTWGDDSLVVWNLDPAAWTRRACEVAGRNLTREEWRQSIGDQPYRRTCAQWPAG